MKNIKLKVETDEKNLAVQQKLMELNYEKNMFVWGVYLDDGCSYYDQNLDDTRGVCSVWKGFSYLVIDEDLDLILCLNEDIWKERQEKEISYDEFIKED